MTILLDTNIVLDILLSRSAFLDDSLDVLEKAIKTGDRMYLSSTAVTDVYYIIHKETSSKEMAIEGICRLASIVNFAEVNEECILNALRSKLVDFEDAVVESTAKHIGADYIITRNINDFKKAKVKALSPKQYLSV